jgi:hypothetical protein
MNFSRDMNELAIFAARHSLPASVAYVLPALFDNAAAKAGLPVRTLLSQATYTNQPLGEYLAAAARKVAAEDQVNA